MTMRVACYYKNPKKLVYYVEFEKPTMVDCRTLALAKKFVAESKVDQAMITQAGQNVMQ